MPVGSRALSSWRFVFRSRCVAALSAPRCAASVLSLPPPSVGLSLDMASSRADMSSSMAEDARPKGGPESTHLKIYRYWSVSYKFSRGCFSKAMLLSSTKKPESWDAEKRDARGTHPQARSYDHAPCHWPWPTEADRLSLVQRTDRCAARQLDPRELHDEFRVGMRHATAQQQLQWDTVGRERIRIGVGMLPPVSFGCWH